MFLVLSASLNPDSRSRILAKHCVDLLQNADRDVTLFDLAVHSFPPCDGGSAYGDANVQRLSKIVEEADGIFIASPVYNYDVNSVAKNALELTGRAWTGKVVSMMLAAGGQGSYMSGMGLANSLMLDFRCLIVPRFVYAVETSFADRRIEDNLVAQRMSQLVDETTKIADAVKGINFGAP
ncbi:NADPH-dependent FMN reductase [Planctomycetes bacterium K23_9]|uniref:NADPH azoreductase n=1 Tax=Stieleria marina TaxID=1930275 RepID=A0A517NNN9_9BACT|nr:NADPH azoreductase [Planctomycetes bacterium K23_9]